MKAVITYVIAISSIIIIVIIIIDVVVVVVISNSSSQRRRAIEALEARPPQYCDCGPDWPLLFKVHEI